MWIGKEEYAASQSAGSRESKARHDLDATDRATPGAKGFRPYRRVAGSRVLACCGFVTLGISGDWRAQPLKVISGITEGIKSLDGTLREAVHIARRNGSSWDEIGKALGVSRQSAWERFSVD